MTLTRTWGVLIGLSLASTVLAAVVNAGQAGQLAMGAILLLAWIKAHLILKTYLKLGRIPSLLRGFDTLLGMTMIAMLGLAVAW
ncbi:MAG: nitric oxide reductase F protein [Rhodobacteraceae bacterium CG17_big_fil_post_rev_8_21_14_2_50_63_15]|nr:MAG: nitric oxide reductase F protein [Rhodobacteraceae bacterium CG17_big_fil_post_rev_8_21_14_2_50_63_15]